MKKYLIMLKSKRVGLAVLAVILACGSGIGLAAKTSNTPAADKPQANAVSTSYASQTSKHKSGKTLGATSSQPDDSTDSDTKKDKTDDSSTKPAVITPTPSPSPSPTATPPAAAAPTITSLYLGQPYFEYTNGPIVTFIVPVTVTGSGNATISWVQDVGGATICSITASFALDQSKEVSCTVSLPVPPNGVWGVGTAGAVYARTATLVGIGGTSW